MTHTVTIDQRYYESAMNYAKLHDISMTRVVEQGLSLLFSQHKYQNPPESSAKPTDWEAAMSYIKTLSAHGGAPVPADEKGIDALTDTKYAQ